MNRSTRATCDKWKINARQRAPSVEAQVKRCHLSPGALHEPTFGKASGEDTIALWGSWRTCMCEWIAIASLAVVARKSACEV